MMEKTPSSPADLAVWIDEQIEYVSGILDTYSGGAEVCGVWWANRAGKRADARKSDWSEQTRASNRCRTIDRELRRFAAQLCSSETVRSLAKLESAFRHAGELLANLKAVREWCVKTAGGGTKQSRRKRQANKSIPLTSKQAETVQIVGECKGNLADAARRLGKDRKTVKDSYDAAMRKLGRAGVKHKTLRLPADRRGQPHLAGEDDRRGI